MLKNFTLKIEKISRSIVLKFWCGMGDQQIDTFFQYSINFTKSSPVLISSSTIINFKIILSKRDKVKPSENSFECWVSGFSQRNDEFVGWYGWCRINENWNLAI